MQYSTLGASGLVVSRLAFGVMTFGAGEGVGVVGFDEADRLVGQAIDAGVNLFDTADVYGGGASETLLGDALRQRREQVLISTKVGSTVGGGVLDARLSSHHVARSIDRSLARLKTDHVDVYIAHRPDYITPLEEQLEALDRVVRAGKCRYIGFSNWPAWMVAKAVEMQKRLGLARFVTGQMYYSLIGRDVEAEIVPAMRDAGCGMMVWSPLASGYLSGKYDEALNGPDGRLSTLRRSFTVPHAREDLRMQWRPIVAALREVAERSHRSAAEVALAWLLSKPAVSTILLGATRADQLAQNLAAIDVSLTTNDLDMLDSVSRPIPGYPETFMRNIVLNDPAYSALKTTHER